MPTCECGCKQPIVDVWRSRPPYYLRDHIERIPCGCGCGVSIEWPHNKGTAKPKRIWGHLTPALRAKHEAMRKPPLNPGGLCGCGCGVLVGQKARWVLGHHLLGKRRPDLGDGRYVNRFGYVLVRMPDHPDAYKYGGYVLEHRLVMEQKLGRPLVTGEGVHHMNHVKADNRPENLELVDRVAHGRMHGRPKGVPTSAEHRAKLSAQMKRVWAERRAAG